MFMASMAISSQSYVGFLSDNYSGVHSVISNPANIVDSRFKTDINIGGASVLVDNDYYGVPKLGDLFKKDFDLKTMAKKYPKKNNNLNLNVDILGPSFMMNIKPKHSIALYTRVRDFTIINNVSGNTIERVVKKKLDKTKDFIASEDNAIFNENVWGEIGASYATILVNKGEHFVKGGLSLKYLKGIGNAYINGKNVNINYDADGNNSSPAIPSVESNGEVSYGHTSNLKNSIENFDIKLDDFKKLLNNSNGFGADIGFIYEWRPKHNTYTYKDNKGNSFDYKDINKYKLKFGLSVTDIGSINYAKATKKVYNIDNKINKSTFDNTSGLTKKLNLYKLIDSLQGTKATLPTALHINADWNINGKFYVNLNTDLSISGNDANTTSISNVYTLTPRFESKWFSFYVPLGMYENAGFQAGAGLRAGPLYIGSGSIISALTNEFKAVDVYVGLKIPIYQSRPKDKDGDGVFNKADACPKTSGPAENGGCPWGDSDGDGVLDNEDKCPKQEGPKENNGCPWGDKDGDSVLDNVDTCPDVAGLATFNGCPDTDGDGIQDSEDKCPKEAGDKAQGGCPVKDADGDGVLDTVDKCPKVPGVKENNGCPAITVEAKAKLDKFARAIYFNSGRTSFKPGVAGKLDLIVSIMKEYDSAKFNIEGHTDSAGRNTTNQRLSEKRAKAVLDYLVRKGIPANRLSSAGYGEDYPIATNATRAGRAENRRVEIKLVK